LKLQIGYSKGGDPGYNVKRITPYSYTKH